MYVAPRLMWLADANKVLVHLGISIFLSMAECGLGIIACSLPPLRRLFYWYFDTASVQPADDSGRLTIGVCPPKDHHEIYTARNFGVFTNIPDSESNAADEAASAPATNLHETAAPSRHGTELTTKSGFQTTPWNSKFKQ